MQTATVKELREELNRRPPTELLQICLRLARFKKDNKELLTYLLFESQNEEQYIKGIKAQLDEEFSQVNTRSMYFIKKSLRKLLRQLKKYIRYSGNKATEVELLLYFCRKMKTFGPDISRNRVLRNLYARQIEYIERKMEKLHEDLQYDFRIELDKLK